MTRPPGPAHAQVPTHAPADDHAHAPTREGAPAPTHATAPGRDALPTSPLELLLRAFAVVKPLLWLAPLLGALMLLVHFWRVGYLPALSFGELGVVLGAFGLFVVVGVAVFLLLVLLPVWQILHWTAHSLMPAPPRSNPNPVVRRRRSLSRRPLPLIEDDAGPIKRRTLSARMRPGGFGMFWVASASAFLLTLVMLLHVEPVLPAQWRGWSLLAPLSVGAFVDFGVMFWMEAGIAPRHLRRLRGTLGQFVLLFALNLMVWPVWLTALVNFQAVPETSTGWVMFVVVAYFLLPFTHWLWYATLRGRHRVVTEVRVMVSLFVLLYAGFWTPLLDGAASTFGFGMMRGADLVLTARGCAIVREALPEQRCVVSGAAGGVRGEAGKQVPRVVRDDKAGGAGDVPGGVPEAQVYRLERVDVLTRIGAEYVIAPPGGIDDRTLPRATLPADEVLALIRVAKQR